MMRAPQYREIVIHLAEQDEGEYRIYAGALESTIGDGYTATVVVNRGACEVYRDEALARGHRWARPDEALAYAIGKGRESCARSRAPAGDASA